MGLVLLFLILALLLGGFGFMIHWLWFFAVVFVLFAIAGHAFRDF